MRISPIFSKTTVVQILQRALLEQTKELPFSLMPLVFAQIFQAVAQAQFLLFSSQGIFCLLPHSHPKLCHKRAW